VRSPEIAFKSESVNPFAKSGAKFKEDEDASRKYEYKIILSNQKIGRMLTIAWPRLRPDLASAAIS
jgi:hypothetical protein